MTWSDVKKTLTAPPPPRSPLLKQPLFTKDVFSTTSFGPGHLIGAGVLVLGIVGLTKLFINRGREQAEQAASPPPSQDPRLAKAENVRGQYGK